jgi:uncharacterized membrane protein YeiH
VGLLQVRRRTDQPTEHIVDLAIDNLVASRVRLDMITFSYFASLTKIWGGHCRRVCAALGLSSLGREIVQLAEIVLFSADHV